MRVSGQQAIGTTDGRSPKTRRTQLAQERRSSSDATHRSSQYGDNSVQEIGSGTPAKNLSRKDIQELTQN